MIAKMISIPQILSGNNDDSPSVSSFKKIAFRKNVAVESNNDVNDDSSSSLATKSMRTVTFSRRVQAKKVRTLNRYPQSEKDAIWYSPEEYAGIKKRCIGTLKLMSAVADTATTGSSSSTFEDCDEYCSRGLEIRLKEASKIRKETKAKAMHAVFAEQSRQSLEDINDPEKIRQVYQEAAATMSQGMANIAGICDQAFVRQEMVLHGQVGESQSQQEEERDI